MEDSFGRSILDKAIEKNVLISLDTDNIDPGTVTKKFVYCMKKNARGINTIIFSTNTYFEFVPLDWNFKQPLMAFGIKLIFDTRLDTDPEGHWLNYYKLRNCSLPKPNLAIGFKSDTMFFQLKEDEYIIGVY